jgi:hypothetical protein
MDWLEPWIAVDGEEKRRLTQEVALEVGVGHLLYGLQVTVVGKSLASDDVLVQLLQYSHEYAVVHLTWQREKSASWPFTTLFLDLDAFATTRIKVDNSGY